MSWLNNESNCLRKCWQEPVEWHWPDDWPETKEGIRSAEGRRWDESGSGATTLSLGQWHKVRMAWRTLPLLRQRPEHNSESCTYLICIFSPPPLFYYPLCPFRPSPLWPGFPSTLLFFNGHDGCDRLMPPTMNECCSSFASSHCHCCIFIAPRTSSKERALSPHFIYEIIQSPHIRPVIVLSIAANQLSLTFLLPIFRIHYYFYS